MPTLWTYFIQRVRGSEGVSLSVLYYLLATLLYLVALPYLLFLRTKAKYKDSIPARFFLKDNPSFEMHSGIWFHACSFGEVRSLKPFIDNLDVNDVRISVITQTGYLEAKKHQGAQVRYLPFEIFLPFWMKKQDVLVVMEAELWPLLFCVAKAKGIRTVLLNARISDNSFASYQRFAWIYRWIFSHVDCVFAQSETDKHRLMCLGAKDIDVCGNIKLFTEYHLTHSFTKQPQKRVIVLASTHAGEEALLLSQMVLREDDQLIVVPRHPERFEEVHGLLSAYAKSQQKSYERFSVDASLHDDIILCNTMGELINLYAIADVVVLGGSFIDGIGGHNPLEPAYFKTRLISGAFVFNQKVLFEAVENAVICSQENFKMVFENIDTYPKSAIIKGGNIKPLLAKIIGKK